MPPKQSAEPKLADPPEKSVVPIDRKPGAITIDEVKQYICPDATDQEIYLFVQLCRSQSLDPWKKEAYLVKYKKRDGSGFFPATMIVGKDVFTKRAQGSERFEGFTAGIIVKDKEGKIVDREGEFEFDKDTLLGGWAEVYVRGYKAPIRARVSRAEYDPQHSNWLKIPATMIRKVALVHALREAFPDELGGLTDESEVGAITVEATPVVEDMMPKRASETAKEETKAPEIETEAPKEETKAPEPETKKPADDPLATVSKDQLNQILDALTETCKGWSNDEKKMIRAMLLAHCKAVFLAPMLSELSSSDVPEVIAWINGQDKAKVLAWARAQNKP